MSTRKAKAATKKQAEQKAAKLAEENQSFYRVVEVAGCGSESTEDIGLSTDFAQLDRAINGLPREGCFVALAGKHNHCQSTFLDYLTIGLLQRDTDTIVFLHTIDDALGDRIPRLLGTKFEYPSEFFKKAGYYLKNLDKIPARPYHFDEVYQQAQAWLNHMIASERLILADVAGLAPQLPALEVWVRSIRAKFPDRSLVVLGDNFHLYDIPGMASGEAKTREMFMFVKRLTTEYRCTIFMLVPLSNVS
jgi:hypothetical protein